VVIWLERGADLHMAQLMPLPLAVSCTSKIQIGFTFLVPAHLGSPGQRAVKRVCVCVCFLGLPGCVGTRKVKPIWILLKQETVCGSGISWAVCKSAPCCRQITTPAPHQSVFTGRMPFLSGYISYHISYQKFIVCPLLREPGA